MRLSFTKRNILTTMCICTLGIVGIFSPLALEAKTVSWSDTFDQTLYSRQGVQTDQLFGNSLLGIRAAIESSTHWEAVLRDPRIYVTRSAEVYDKQTGQRVVDGAGVTVGDVLVFTFSDFTDDDVRWESEGTVPTYATLQNAVSPPPMKNYRGAVAGQFAKTDCRQNFGYTSSCGAPGSTCECSLHTQRDVSTDALQTYPVCTTCNISAVNSAIVSSDLYAPVCSDSNLVRAEKALFANATKNIYTSLVVTQPLSEIGRTEGLSCERVSDTVTECTVVDTGTISSSFVWSESAGRFYYSHAYQHSLEHGDVNDVSYVGIPDRARVNCFGNTVPLHSSSQYVAESDVIDPSLLEVAIPGMELAFTFEATEGGVADIPSVSGPVNGNSSDMQTFQFSSEEEGPVRFGIDWNNDGEVDQLIPENGYEEGSQTLSREWDAAGIYTFGVFVKTEKGQRSDFSGHSIEISKKRLGGFNTVPAEEVTFVGTISRFLNAFGV